MIEFLTSIKIGIIAVVISFASLLGYIPQQELLPLGSTLPIAGQNYTLSGSGISSSATSITLSSLTLTQTGYEILDADMSSTFYLTLEPGNKTKQEIASCTTVTQNANNTATLSGCSRGLLPITPYTASSTYAFAHGGGTSVIFSNPPQFYNQFLAADNSGTISGQYTFSTSPIVPTVVSASTTNAASVNYVNNIALQSAASSSDTVTGVTKLSVTAADPNIPIAVGDNDTRVSPVSLATVTAGQVAALAGSAGTPSSTTTYVTLADITTTTSASKIVRTNASGTIDMSFGMFGGNGSDGVLNATSATTTIDLGGATYVTKNYTSINISSGAEVTFSNPSASGTIIVLKSKGDVTIAGLLNAKGMGAAGGASVAINTAGQNASTSEYIFAVDSSNGKAGLVAKTAGGGGVTYLATTRNIYYTSTVHLFRKSSIYVTAGSGGGSGAGASNGGGASGAGGRGGGAVVIESAGAWNFTGTISTAGVNGIAAVVGTQNGSGGGGGGAGGMIVALYNTLTTSSGTTTVSGGNGGAGATIAGSGTNADGAGGGGGGGMFNGAGGVGGAGGANIGGSGNNGSSGSNSLTTGAGAGTGGAGGAGGSSNSGGGGGGGGTAGEYLIVQNTEYF